ncbi:prosome, macropain 26S subunit, ATPase 5, isoform CRA_f [Mycena olivaceomarginata]|nr:prosome, macropain 26S subunit, ATPase 5, isoform CRA_f [Mycena olivaceomarginata]
MGADLFKRSSTSHNRVALAVVSHGLQIRGSELVQKYIGECVSPTRRESGSGGEDSEVQRTMLLDGFEPSKNIKVIMATNRINGCHSDMCSENDADILDLALVRPGQIDQKLEFPQPGPEACLSILRIHSHKGRMSLQCGINLRVLAKKMGQCSGIYALREQRQHIMQENFEFSMVKVLKKNQERNMSVNKLF